MNRLTVLAAVAVLALVGCSSSAGATRTVVKPTPTVDPVVKAITDRYGDCLIKLKFTKPFDINVYQSTHKADVSGTPGVVGFLTSTSNSGKLLIIPDASDSSARVLASVGC
jgi:hypothetical protein